MARLTPEQRALFEAKNFVTVATLGPDGGPRSTCTWVDVDDDGRVQINGAATRQWIKNLQRDPRLSLTVFDMEDPYRKVTIHGRAEELTTEGARDHIDRLAHKYTGREKWGSPEERVLVRVGVDTVHTYGL